MSHNFDCFSQGESTFYMYIDSTFVYMYTVHVYYMYMYMYIITVQQIDILLINCHPSVVFLWHDNMQTYNKVHVLLLLSLVFIEQRILSLVQYSTVITVWLLCKLYIHEIL